MTYVVAIDGFSGKIVANSIMPLKNNLIIYDEVYRWEVVLTFTDAQSYVLFENIFINSFNNFSSKLSLEYDWSFMVMIQHFGKVKEIKILFWPYTFVV